MEWTFSKQDIENVKIGWERKRDKIKELSKYSLKRKKYSTVDKLNRWIESLHGILSQEEEVEKLLDDLNRGVYKFSPFKFIFYIDKYFLKLRTTLKIVGANGIQLSNNKAFYDFLVSKLIANKVFEFLKEKDLLMPPRNKAISELVRKLRDENNLKIIKGDFVSYTQNIPRKSLEKELKNFLDIPDNVVNLILAYLEAGNTFSVKTKTYDIRSFFSKIRFENDYLFDGDFRSIINESGVLAGTPISTLLGHVFLLRFDKKMKEIATGNGFYCRYNDDFILLYPSNLEFNVVKSEIINFIRDLYDLRGRDLQDIERKVVRIDNLKVGKDIDFLGYILKKTHVGGENGGNKKRPTVSISIRYKTLKKFIFKYLIEYKLAEKEIDYRLKNIKNKEKDDEIRRYIAAKAIYLNNWLLSFIHINDKDLLDLLYIKFVLPDLYNMIRIYLKENDRKKLSREVNKLKPFFKLTRIRRQLLELRKGKGEQNPFLERIEDVSSKIIKILEEMKCSQH